MTTGTSITYVSSPEFHKDLILKAHPGFEGILHVTGFPIRAPVPLFDYAERARNPKQVVFPHRLVPEKHPDWTQELSQVLGSDFTHNTL